MYRYKDFVPWSSMHIPGPGAINSVTALLKRLYSLNIEYITLKINSGVRTESLLTSHYYYIRLNIPETTSCFLLSEAAKAHS